MSNANKPKSCRGPSHGERSAKSSSHNIANSDNKSRDIPRKPSNLELLIVNNIPSMADSETTAELDYELFLKTLPKKQQQKLASIEDELISTSNINTDKPLKYRILVSGMPKNAKILALEKLKNFSKMTCDDQGYFKLNDWFQTVLRIPFSNLVNLPVSKYADSEDLKNFLISTRKHLDHHIHGLALVKNSFMQLLAQDITNPESTSCALGLEGPPGCGKTMSVITLAKSLKRPFHLIGLGGCKDSSYLIGHDFTYLGSKCGHLVEILISSGSMNPIIFFDELDKLSETSHGQEITGLLIHLIDATQNKFIQDKYLSGIDLDFSRVLFIFSYNDISKIDSILLDRIINIKIDAYDKKDKKVIAFRHLLPETFKNVGLHPDLLHFDDECIDHIINSYTQNESGVRSLKRVIDHLCKQINLLILSQDDTMKFSFQLTDFPIRLQCRDIDCLLKTSIMKIKKEFLSYYI